MTEDELTAIEARAAAWTYVPKALARNRMPRWVGQSQMVDSLLTLGQDDVPALLAEVRRLQQALHDAKVDMDYWKACRL